MLQENWKIEFISGGSWQVDRENLEVKNTSGDKGSIAE